MNPNAIEKSLLWNRATEKNVMDFHGDEIMMDLNCHQIGTIQSFDATTQTASATVDIQKTLYVYNPASGLQETLLQAYPALTDCPVKFTCGLNGGFTVPPKQGDKCLIHYNDRDMDAWFGGLLNQEPNSGRIHDFSDAIIEIGPNPEVSPLPNFSTVYAMLRNGAGTSFVGVDISNGKISIQNPSQNLATLIQNLISEIKGMTIVVTGGSGVVSPTDQANLTTIATNFGQVLE